MGLNALVLTLSPRGPVTLPMAYQQLLQGALYRVWRDTVPELHDEGYASEGRAFRMFTFSGLEGQYQAEGAKITFSGPLTFEVRSPVPALMEPLADFFTAERAFRAGETRLPIAALHTRDCLLFPESALISMRTPVTVHRTLPDGHTVFYSPLDTAFPELVAENLSSKLAAAHLSLDPFVGITPIERTLRKRVTTFKGTYLTGWTGLFRLDAHPETLAFLYYTGLGAGNSRGFGMFDVIRTIT